MLISSVRHPSLINCNLKSSKDGRHSPTPHHLHAHNSSVHETKKKSQISCHQSNSPPPLNCPLFVPRDYLTNTRQYYMCQMVKFISFASTSCWRHRHLLLAHSFSGNRTTSHICFVGRVRRKLRRI